VGSVAVITGGGGGLGRATAEALAGRGYDLALTGRTRSSLEETAAVVERLGRKALVAEGDVGDAAHVARFFAASLEQLGPCDALLHAAATHGTPMRFADAPDEELDHVIRTNLRGTFLVTRAALKQMHGRGGSIVLVSSAGTLRGFPLAAPYAATKSALAGFARTLAAEVGADNIRVNVLTPGAMPETAIYQSAMPGIAEELGIAPDDGEKLLAEMSALGRACTPAEVARAVVFLATGDSSAMTGQNLVVDAGLTV
jgi:NAD(P)-dependent dehydrogenase (short-subunit alcohol dehydrogenase family)